ncbi:hypothetical protein AYO45_00565 [Gammaproteobacteria bacterium SCGC AG-212-F23]|nr:hypothetical protein AYO45_00565 [Gammaproteobacteria bacterium SCGC AG-212-F23]
MTIKKYLFGFAVLSSIATSAYAVGEGFLIGAQIGQTNTHYPTTANVMTGLPKPVFVLGTNSNSTGMGGRLFLGYTFNPYISSEFGLTHYANTVYKTNGFGSPAVRENAFDIVARGTWLFGETGFGVLGKLGLGIMSVTTSPSLAASLSSNSTSAQTSVRPLFGMGVSYDITQNWVADLTFTRITKGGSLKGNSDFTAFGIAYHFADKYCGQFLC